MRMRSAENSDYFGEPKIAVCVPKQKSGPFSSRRLSLSAFLVDRTFWAGKFLKNFPHARLRGHTTTRESYQDTG